jgi:hypothetical protein
MTDLYPELDIGCVEGAADVIERSPLTFGTPTWPSDAKSATTGGQMRHAVPAPDLGALPGYLEVGLWAGRLTKTSDTGRLRLNPELCVDGDDIIVADPVTGIDAQFAAGAAMLPLLSRIIADPTGIDRLPDALRERLFALGVLIDDGAPPVARHAWSRAVADAACAFAAGGFAELAGPCSPAILAFLRERYRRMAREAALPYGDPQCPTRWIAHNEPAALALHTALAPTVSAIVGRPLQPSYLYLGVYAEGSSLPRHTDRAQCEITVSLLIDYLPDPGGRSPWPLLIFPEGEPVAIHQRIGDAVIFDGRSLEHARPALPMGQMSSSLFFHFVSEDFVGRMD